MSVIPLITGGQRPSVVQNQQDFEVDGHAVLIGNLDLTQLTDETPSNVSYDFRVGDKYRSHRERDPKEIPDGGTTTLHHGSALIIQTEEYVHLPRHMFGIIAPKVSLLQQGVEERAKKVSDDAKRHNR